MRARLWLLMALIMALSIGIAAGCGDDDDDGGGEGASGDLDGTTVSIFGAYVDEEASRFEASVAAFEDETGIDIQYEGTPDFANLIRIRVDGGDAPDIAMFPQPGLMAGFARDGALKPLDGELLTRLQDNYPESWQELAAVDGTPYVMWYKTAVKSLVWTPAPQFAEAGYEAPQTFDELNALADQIQADGTAPWCIGIENAGATGWVGTDWIEDIMLRLHGPEVYDQWVSHEIPFNDPRVKEAFDMLGSIWLDDDKVFGGTRQILTTPFGDSPRALFSGPDCFLHRQAGFITSFFPDDVQESLTTDAPQAEVFYFPAINEEFTQPVLVAGDGAAMFNDRPEVRAVMDYLGQGESGTEWTKAGSYLSPHNDFDATLLPTQAERDAADILAGASVVRFDGSDLMPAAVGGGSFWRGMVEYVNGKDADEVLNDIEESFPEGS